MIVKTYYLFIVVILLASCSKDKIGNAEDSLSFQVLTLNTFLLDTPDITNGPTCESDCVARAQSICDVLSDKFDVRPDVLLLQEVFEQNACVRLSACLSSLGYQFISPCQEGDPNWTNSCLVESSKSSGLLIASKFQIDNYEFISFTDCNGCLLQGGDCQANKGFQYGIIRPNADCTIHLINTHLDAGDNNGDEEARFGQSVQIKEFVDGKSLTNDDLILYGGDFNTSSLEELLQIELRLAIKSLNQEVPTSNSGKVLDHLLHGSNPAITTSSFDLTQTCEPECINWFDSDHYGILGKFTFSCSE